MSSYLLHKLLVEDKEGKIVKVYGIDCISTEVSWKNIDNVQWLFRDISHQEIHTLWCSDYHYCITSFNKAWTQVLCRFKSCSRHVGDSRWWGSLTMVPTGNKAKCLSSVNHTTKTIHQHHHHQVVKLMSSLVLDMLDSTQYKSNQTVTC